MSLASKLEKIRSPKLQNQHQTAVVLSAVEDTLRDQKTDFTPTAYFAAILALLSQSISSSNGIVNKELAYAVVYLLDLVTPFTPHPLLRSKFTQILTHLAPALTHRDAEAPLLRSACGCLETLLVAQDAAAWALPQSQISPRRALVGVFSLAMDHRPKVRKRAQDALVTVLKNPPPSPSLDHPAADMCAEASLRTLNDLANASGKTKRIRGHKQESQHEPGLIHALQLVKTVASASGGWPSRKIEPLCEILLNISKSSHEYLTMAAFEVFEVIFEGMADEVSSAKLPRLMEVISELRPSQNDSQLLPPWIAVLSRGYDVSAQVNPDETFQKLPELFESICSFLSSSSHNIRISASECLISLLVNCIPENILLNSSVYEEKVLEKLGKSVLELLSIKYQPAWMEVFKVLESMFEVLKWKADPILVDILRTIGELRGNDSFNGNKEAEQVISKAITAMGPLRVLDTLPLNLANPKAGQTGRVWMLPLLRDSVGNTYLSHFKSEFIPLSEIMFQRVLDNHAAEKTMNIKIYETLVQQIWSILPGYCDLPLDVTEAFDQAFAEVIANILYKQVDLRVDVCKALQILVDSNQSIQQSESVKDDLVLQRRISKDSARKNIEYLATLAANMLAVLFNVYSQTLPHSRGYILRCINAYLSITPEQELVKTFLRVSSLLESSLSESSAQTQAEKQKQKKGEDKMPPTSHTLMDLVITISIYLPRESFASLFNIAALIIMKDDDPQLQKKAYKLIPRLAKSEIGRTALQERNDHLQQLLLSSAEKASAPSKRDRLAAISVVVDFLPSSDLHFIPSILAEVVVSCKEVNEKARTSAFDLLVLMGSKMSAPGGIVVNSKVEHMPDNSQPVPASLEEYFTMVSAGLAGATPHMISASITALARILYHFREELKESVMQDLVSTMDLFLTSSSREIVRSCLGFVKVAVISLPNSLILPKLQSLIPNLMVWSHEHKAHFKSKVKHILERMIRRFGVTVVERNTPEDDKKLIANIRKSKERAKRKKATEGGEDEDMQNGQSKKNGRFESEFDEVAYGSDESNESSSDVSDNEVLGRSARKTQKTGQTFIVEDEDEPLDLLDKRALANISSTKPLKHRHPGLSSSKKSSVKTNADGKLMFGGREDDADNDAEMIDFGADGNGAGASTADGIGAYVDAIRGKDAVKRGQRGKLKFSNKRTRDDGEMDIDDEDVSKIRQKVNGSGSGRGRERERERGRARGGRGGFQKSARKGLGVMKSRGASRGGRVEKPRGRIAGRGRR
ncbi:MAG: hypothetical protein M1829_002381 [Trizodia sp. TS-e1964]|nr:MAG: hypothetical protein M1829_002381 [Trizodia sp. TS-e1964]